MHVFAGMRIEFASGDNPIRRIDNGLIGDGDGFVRPPVHLHGKRVVMPVEAEHCAGFFLEGARANALYGNGCPQVAVIEEKDTTCCYARSDKQWVADPQGVPWETFFTHGEATVYGQSGALTKLGDASGGLSTCGCAPAALTRPAAEPEAPEVSFNP